MPQKPKKYSRRKMSRSVKAPKRGATLQQILKKVPWEVMETRIKKDLKPKSVSSLKTTAKKPLKLQYVKADYARLLSAIHKTTESSRFTYLLMPLKFLWSIRWLIYLILLPISILLILYGLNRGGGLGNIVLNVMGCL